MVIIVIVLSLAEETESSTVGANRAYSNGRSKENKCSHGVSTIVNMIYV